MTHEMPNETPDEVPGDRVARGDGRTSGKHYDAFVSYSHAGDGSFAPALQDGMQRIGKAWRQRRALEVFRDQTGLAVDPDLWQAIVTALDSADWFVLLASPESAASHWVGKEIEHCLATKGADRILIVLTDGTLAWDADRRDFSNDSTAAHPLLRGAFAREPVWVDLSWARGETDLTLRNARFRDRVAALVAPLRGMEHQGVLAEDARQRRRTARVVQGAIGALAVLLVLSVAAAGAAVSNQREADQQRASAEAAARTAEEQRSVAEAEARVAKSRELAAQALRAAGEGALAAGSAGADTGEAATRKQTQLAMLLAAQAHQLSPTDEAAAAMLTIVSGVGVDAGLVSPLPPAPDGLAAEDITSVSAKANRIAVQKGAKAVVVTKTGGKGAPTWELPKGIWALTPDGDTAVSRAGSVVRLTKAGKVRPADFTLSYAAAAPRFAEGSRFGIYPLSQTEVGFIDTTWNAVAVVDLKDGAETSFYLDVPICSDQDCWSGLLTVSPDGTQAVVRASGQLQSFDLSGDEPVKTSGPRAGGNGMVRISDDGTTLHVRDGDQVQHLDPDSFVEKSPPTSAANLGRLDYLDDGLALAGPSGCDGLAVVDGSSLVPSARIAVETTFLEGVGCEPDDPGAVWFDEGRSVITRAARWPRDGEDLLGLVCTSVGRDLTKKEQKTYLGADFTDPVACEGDLSPGDAKTEETQS